MRISVDIHPGQITAAQYSKSHAVVELDGPSSGAAIFLNSAAMCDELIKAAVAAKDMLLGETSEPAPETPAQDGAGRAIVAGPGEQLGDGLYRGDWQGDQPGACGHTRRAYGACVRQPAHPGWHRNVTGEEWPQYTEDRDLDAILNGPSYRTPAIELPGRGI